MARPKKKGLRIFLRIVLIVVGLFVIGGVGMLLANYVIMPLITGKGAEVEVPDVVGMYLEDALIRLEEQSFEPVADEKRPDTLYEEGVVVEQKPRAGALVKKGRLVQLTVSAGEESVRVPYLLGLTIDQAEAISERRGFSIASVDTVKNDTVPAGRIAAQKPDPEIRVKPGTSLHLYQSAGPSGKDIPLVSLIDTTLVRAREILEVDSLYVEVIHQKVPGKGGIVVLQSPEPGVLMAAEDTVRLYVGEEP
ncbi:PASTA domain-containing protein [candidate division WOR-3 bacterium]|uniref:PASTA domain-containing protein n=1 Tax=candidate division WOR-3 bacterium TaxID=2052148 RepID=A0A9D5QEX8_UNCW3|nr:PASTA domain-containing protein [candidate division WOR-3 bacterium]MBD3365445.1 PASTA domain-containing protein [candidate division WOR-3 bacterium]